MDSIIGFKNLVEEELENCPLTDDLREKITTQHENLMAIVSLNALKEPEEVNIKSS